MSIAVATTLGSLFNADTRTMTMTPSMDVHLNMHGPGHKLNPTELFIVSNQKWLHIDVKLSDAWKYFIGSRTVILRASLVYENGLSVESSLPPLLGNTDVLLIGATATFKLKINGLTTERCDKKNFRINISPLTEGYRHIQYRTPVFKVMVKIDRRMQKREAAAMLLKVATSVSGVPEKKRSRKADNTTDNTSDTAESLCTETLWKMTDKHDVLIKELIAQQSFIRNEITSLSQMMASEAEEK